MSKRQWEILLRQGESIIEAHFNAKRKVYHAVSEQDADDHMEELVDRYIAKCDELGRIMVEIFGWVESGETRTVIPDPRKPGRMHLSYPRETRPDSDSPLGEKDPGLPTDSGKR